MKTVPITIMVDEVTAEKIATLHWALKMTKSEFIRQAIAEKIARNE